MTDVETLAKAPGECTESRFAELLAGVLGVQHVPLDGHFFEDLDADSLVMATFCARVRKQPDLPTVSMKDIYRHPTIRGLAAGLGRPPVRDHGEPASVDPASERPAASPVYCEPESGAQPGPIATSRYLLCGALQSMAFLAYSLLLAAIGSCGYEWVSAGGGPVDDYLRAALSGAPAQGDEWLAGGRGIGVTYLRAVVFGAGSLIGLSLLPIAAKWALIGRWRACEIRIWSVAYFWFWLVKTLVRASPPALFAGSPIYVLYLRALGAKIGAGATILSRNVPVCTDLLTVGAGTVIRKDSTFNCYRARGGVIQTGRVTLGEDVVVGEASVLDIGTAIGHGSQLGHASALHTGQRVPALRCWHGSPAEPTEADYRTVEPVLDSTLRRATYSCLQLVWLMLVTLPVPIALAVIILRAVPGPATLRDTGPAALTAGSFYPAGSFYTAPTFYLGAFVVSIVVFLGGLVVAGLGSIAVPRMLDRFVEPDRVYRLYGLHYWLHRGVVRMSNVAILTKLLGDSSFIVGYLSRLGYDLSHVQQTGSNFGLQVRHDTPYQSTVGTGTMVADGLSMINTAYSSTSFRVARVSVGARSFLGNYIAYPAEARVGDNCLLGTKVMVPTDGAIRRGVGLLGSPSFEIPRTVDRDTRFDHLATGDELRRRLKAKNRHNAITIAMFLALRWFNLFGLVLVAASTPSLYKSLGVVAVAAELIVAAVFTICLGLLVGRGCRRLQALAPNGCSIYETEFWRHERFWKVPIDSYIPMFNGTPFKVVIWRMLGVKIGAKVFDDGCVIAEKTFVTIGHHCTLNAGTHIQGHSQEDGAFKSDRITLENGCTLGVGAFVHYGVTMCEGATLEADAFLMKGEQVPAFAWWTGNPAAPVEGSR